MPWHGFDVFRRMQQLAQLRNALVKIVIFDDGIRPDGLHECVFAHEFAGILHQQAKRVEKFAPKADLLVVTKKPSLGHVKDVVAKQVPGHSQIASGIGGAHASRTSPHARYSTSG